ncbi:hypothetical protein HDV05_002970 [Chytridiales sp. JEL 0842]|nr:hypothetical protein HDV05_002970 [Chytridiales sp. JEL 0842]
MTQLELLGSHFDQNRGYRSYVVHQSLTDPALLKAISDQATHPSRRIPPHSLVITHPPPQYIQSSHHHTILEANTSNSAYNVNLYHNNQYSPQVYLAHLSLPSSYPVPIAIASPHPISYSSNSPYPISYSPQITYSSPVSSQQHHQLPQPLPYPYQVVSIPPPFPYAHELADQQQQDAYIHEGYRDSYLQRTNVRHHVLEGDTLLHTDPNGETLAFSNESNIQHQWHDNMLNLAHQQYSSGNYMEALSILQELFAINSTHIPTLLLLGCTSYSLKRFDLSILYNNTILELDSKFAEAYSNLGTTYRALASSGQLNLPTRPLHELVPLSDSALVTSSIQLSGASFEYLILSERYYRTALKIRPYYWDASVNLAGLLSSQGRYSEAVQVYDAMESILDDEMALHENVSATIAKSALTRNELEDIITVINYEESRLHRLHQCNQSKIAHDSQIRNLHTPRSVPNLELWNADKRRDMHFTKGNIKSAMGDLVGCRHEYLRGLVSVGLGSMLRSFVEAMISPQSPSAKSNPLPPSLISPKTSLTVWQHMQKCQLTRTDWKALVTYSPSSSIVLSDPSFNPTDAAFHPSTAATLQTLAKIAQDTNQIGLAVSLYYLSLAIHPSANVCNNIGILLATHRSQESIQWYELGLQIEPSHVHIYTNLGSALKDNGQLQQGIACYERAIALQPDFHIALANLANLLKDMGMVEEAITFYRRALLAKPDFVEAFCNYVNSLLFICDWADRDKNLLQIKSITDSQLREGLFVTSNSSTDSGYKPLQSSSRMLSTLNPTLPTVLPFHTFTYSSLTSSMIREISRRNAFRIYHNILTSPWYPGAPSRPISLLNQSTAPDEMVLRRALHFPYPTPPPLLGSPHIKVGYLSSDFNNHPLSHLMQSVFGMHNRKHFVVYAYSLSASDGSSYRSKIEAESDVFIDVSQWSNKAIVKQIQKDGVHILCNLNGYTKGSRGEIFAARAAPIQMAFMGFAGTLGAGYVNDPETGSACRNEIPWAVIDEDNFGLSSETNSKWIVESAFGRWIDYLVTDEIACPRRFVCGEQLPLDEADEAAIFEQENGIKWQPIGRGLTVKDDDRNRMYTENIIFMPQTFFVNDHRQGFREQPDPFVETVLMSPSTVLIDEHEMDSTCDLSPEELLEWRKEQIRRLKMRGEMFPWLREDTVIFANFNQLYKIDPEIFECWINILRRVPNSILWLLRFPPAGEAHLRKWATEHAGSDVSNRIVFTDVVSKHMHVTRGRIADIFLDTPECNAHTTAADILWSGTPILTYPKYDFRMCSRVAASVAYATGTWPESEEPPSYKGILEPGLPTRLKDTSLLGHTMVVNSYQEYEDRAVDLATNMRWRWVPIKKSALERNDSACFLNLKSESADAPPSYSPSSSISTPILSPFYPPIDVSSQHISEGPNAPGVTQVLLPYGVLTSLRRRLFLTRDSMPLFDTQNWVRNLEKGMLMAIQRWEGDWERLRRRNEEEVKIVLNAYGGGGDWEVQRLVELEKWLKGRNLGKDGGNGGESTRCFYIEG